MTLRNLFIAVLLLLLITGLSCHQKGVNTTHPSAIEAADPPAQTDSPTSREALRIAYIGNMGVLLESDTQTVIIDGLHEFYKPDYIFPSSSTIDQLIRGNYPDFTLLEAVLITHHHLDHFSSNYSEDFLLENQEAILIGPAQVQEDLAISQKNIREEQIKVISYDRQLNNIVHAGITIKALRCDHANPARHNTIQNIAYLININDHKILHVGDTNWAQLENSLAAFNLAHIGLDVAILPYWMLLETGAKQWIDEKIAPNKIIATHLPPTVDNQEQEQLRQAYPNTTLFMKQGTVIKINTR